MSRSRKFLVVATFIVLSFFSVNVQAQCPNPFDPLCETGDPDLQVPLDTNVVILLVFAAAAGCYTILKQRKLANENS